MCSPRTQFIDKRSMAIVLCHLCVCVAVDFLVDYKYSIIREFICILA